MATVNLGDAEKRFIIHGIQDDLRNDGRKCEDYRHIDLEVGVLDNAHGSSRLRIGNSELLVGVKLELGKPSSSHPNEGCILFHIDCSPNATPQFQGRGGEDIASFIKSLLIRAYSNRRSINLRALCVVPAQDCWVVNVDVLILECGGNLMDAVSVAVKSALHNTAVPNLTVIEGDEGELEISLPDDPYDGSPIDTTNCPLFVTLSKVKDRHIVDATMIEEACSLASAVFCILWDGKCTAVRKQGSGSLDPESIIEMIDTARKVGVNLHKSLQLFVKKQEKQNHIKTGFL